MIARANETARTPESFPSPSRRLPEIPASLRQRYGDLPGVAVVMLLALARTLVDRPTAYIAAILLAFSPIANWYSNEIRMFEMAGLFSLLALAFLAPAALRGRVHYWPGYVACAALAIYSDYSAAYIV